MHCLKDAFSECVASELSLFEKSSSKLPQFGNLLGRCLVVLLIDMHMVTIANVKDPDGIATNLVFLMLEALLQYMV